MNSKTSFRKTLLEELTIIADSHELDERFVQMKYVEEKEDVLGEFIDYYSDSLLRYKTFTDEFTPTEIKELHIFLNFLRISAKGKGTWPEVRIQAGMLLGRLRK